MHTAILGQVVGDGIVLGDTVVPHRHRPPVPAEADLKVGLVDMVEQRRQEALTVAAGHPQHVRGEMAIDVEKRLPGHGVVGDNRMHRRSHGCHALIETRETALGEKLIPVRARRMHGREVAEIRFHAVLEGFIGRVHTAPERIPATVGNGFGVQNRGKRRVLLKREIRVPDIGIGPAVAIVFQQHHALVARHVGVDMVRGVELAKGGGKREERCRRQRLIGKEQHQMLDEQLIEAIAHRLTAISAQVDTFNQRANGGGQTIDAQGMLGHECIPSATGFSMRTHDHRTAAGRSIAHPRNHTLPGRVHSITTTTKIHSSETPSLRHSDAENEGCGILFDEVCFSPFRNKFSTDLASGFSFFRQVF